jgi:uncharacterized protein (DUF1778 family)
LISTLRFAAQQTEDVMSYRRTPPLSREGTREVLEEMANPPEDTPERRETFKRMRYMREMRKRQGDTEPIGLKR